MAKDWWPDLCAETWVNSSAVFLLLLFSFCSRICMSGALTKTLNFQRLAANELLSVTTSLPVKSKLNKSSEQWGFCEEFTWPLINKNIWLIMLYSVAAFTAFTALTFVLCLLSSGSCTMVELHGITGFNRPLAGARLAVELRPVTAAFSFLSASSLSSSINVASSSGSQAFSLFHISISVCVCETRYNIRIFYNFIQRSEEDNMWRQ